MQGCRIIASPLTLRYIYRAPFSVLTRFNMPSKDKKYTDPKLREEVKEEIQQGDKGGAPGQWSARKVCVMLELDPTCMLILVS